LVDKALKAKLIAGRPGSYKPGML